MPIFSRRHFGKFYGPATMFCDFKITDPLISYGNGFNNRRTRSGVDVRKPGRCHGRSSG